SLGLCGVSRPSNTGGGGYLAELLRGGPGDRDVIITAERDRKPDGRWPGYEGAMHVARELAGRLGRPLRLAFCPDDAKDFRAWLSTQKIDLDDQAAVAECRERFLLWVRTTGEQVLPREPEETVPAAQRVRLDPWVEEQLRELDDGLESEPELS